LFDGLIEKLAEEPAGSFWNGKLWVNKPSEML
jgi:hypothetical protein